MKKLILILWFVPVMLFGQNKLTYKTSRVQTILDTAVIDHKMLIDTIVSTPLVKVADTALMLSKYPHKLSPTLTGIPTAPTAAIGTNTTQIATTAFVNANSFFSMVANSATLNPSDGDVLYCSQSFASPASTSGNLRLTRIPMNCTLVGYVIEASVGTPGCSQESSVFAFRYNNTTDVTLSNAVQFNATGGAANSYYNMGLSTSLTAGDTWEIKWTCPSWATNPQSTQVFITLFFKVR
jgi:hypothetical protein